VTQTLGLSLFVAGLLGGATHCAGMCGPFVLVQVQGLESEGKGMLSRLAGAALIPYHAGRITTYVAMAVILGSIVNLAFLFQPAKALIAAPMLTIAGVIFLVSAFPKLSSIFPWAGYIRVSMSYRWVSRLSGALSQNPGMVKRYLLGVLLGFMPCGLVVSALMAAGTAGTALQAGFAMAAFGAGTAVALIVLAIGGGAFVRAFPVTGKRLQQGAMALSALWLFVIAGKLFLV